MPLPRPITIGLAARFARPLRTILTLAAVLLGATAVTFAVGLTTSLKRLLDGISHQQAEPVQIQMPGNGFQGGPKQVKVGPKHFKAGPPTVGAQVPTAKAEREILAAVHSQPATLHVVAQADDSASVAGLSEQIPVTAFRGAAGWTGYDLVSGHWYTGPYQVLAPTGFLTQTGTSVGNTISLAQGRKRLHVRIVGEIFDTHNRGLNLVTSWSTLRTLDPSVTPDQFDVGLRPGTSASTYANALNRRLGPDYGVELNARGPAVVDAMIGLIGTLAALLAAVAALGVLNTVVLDTRDRVHDIGIFKAVGMTPRQTTAMAISWVATIGLIAGVIAVPIGVALHNEILPAMAGSVGLRLPASFLNVYGTPTLLMLASAGVLIAILGALAPATWAARIHTATALHTE
jgi:putative ABC transport system permease protein